MGSAHRVPGQAPDRPTSSLSPVPPAQTKFPIPASLQKSWGPGAAPGCPGPQGPLAFTSHLTPRKGGVGSEPGGPPVRLCAPHLFQPRAGGSSATPGPGAATGEDERRAGSCMRNASETLSSSPGPHRSVFCLPSLNTQYQLGSQLGISRHFPNGQRAPR